MDDIKNPIEIVIDKLNLYRLFRLRLIATFVLYQKTIRQPKVDAYCLIDAYLKLADAYCEIGLFGTSQQIALKAIEKIQDLSDSHEKTWLNAYALYEIGCSFSSMGDYGNATKNHRLALDMLEAINDSSNLYCHILLSYAHDTFKMDWVPNRISKGIAKISATVMNAFKSQMISRQLRSESINNREHFLQMIKHFGMPTNGITDEDKLIEMYISQMKEDFVNEINISEMVNLSMLTIDEGQSLCRKIINLATDKTIAITAYELLTLSYGKKQKEEALQCIEKIMSEIDTLSRYPKNARLLFAYKVKSFFANDDHLRFIAADISLTRCENDRSFVNLISCCNEFANILNKLGRVEEAIYLYEEAKTLYSQLSEVNFFDLKEVLENLSICYEKIGNSEKSALYKAEADKYSTMRIGAWNVTHTNLIEDLDIFLQSETMRIFHWFGQYTLHDLTEKESFQEFEEHFIEFVEHKIASLENAEDKFRDFDVCHKILLSILSGERRKIEIFMDESHSQYIYNEALFYRDGSNGRAKDMNKSFELLHQAYKLGCVDATTEIGLLYSVDPVSEAILEGIPDYRDVEELRERNIPLAKLYWKEAALKGDGRAMFLMGQHYYDIESYSNAEFWLDLASEHGFVYANYLLGALYSNSENKRFFNYDEAVARYTKVANSAEERYQGLAESAKMAIEKLSERFMMYNIQRAGGWSNYYKPYFDNLQESFASMGGQINDNSNEKQ